MTETEYQRCDDDKALLAALASRLRRWPTGAVGDRKFRLYGCACCRRAWPQVRDQRCRDAVATAEGYAEGLVEPEELREAWQAACAAKRTRHHLAATLCAKAGGERDLAARAGALCGLRRADRVALVRCLFADPFRPLYLCGAEGAGHGRTRDCPACGAVRRWNGGVVLQLAADIYENHRWLDMPALADILREAGCRASGLLAHCRAAGPHGRGCWVLDRLLGLD